MIHKTVGKGNSKEPIVCLGYCYTMRNTNCQKSKASYKQISENSSLHKFVVKCYPERDLHKIMSLSELRRKFHSTVGIESPFTLRPRLVDELS